MGYQNYSNKRATKRDFVNYKNSMKKSSSLMKQTFIPAEVGEGLRRMEGDEAEKIKRADIRTLSSVRQTLSIVLTSLVKPKLSFLTMSPKPVSKFIEPKTSLLSTLTAAKFRSRNQRNRSARQPEPLKNVGRGLSALFEVKETLINVPVGTVPSVTMR